MFHLKRFKVKNFKAFRESASVELKPLTVFAGVNSSGKSSFIQGMLLLKQSLERQRYPRLHLSGPEPGELFADAIAYMYFCRKDAIWQDWWQRLIHKDRLQLFKEFT